VLGYLRKNTYRDCSLIYRLKRSANVLIDLRKWRAIVFQW